MAKRWVNCKKQHGESGTTLYNLWCGIKTRCHNENRPQYKDWGGRGIKMYSPWISNYEMFRDWILDNLGEKPDGYSLDRIDNDGNYEPGNLRWATRQEQNKNKRPFKLSKTDVLEIKWLLSLGVYTNQSIADDYDCSRATISDIKRNRRRSNIKL